MKFVKPAMLAALLSAAVVAPAAAQEKPGSLHVQCDGMPNNMTSGETAARLLGAVTLLGLFAPPIEQADASKRKFGADGVAVCSQLLEGEKKEGNANRRVDLILARAIHRIEAKDYDAAIADAALARSEATAAGLMADPYYARSQGRAADMVEAAALYRQGKGEAARAAATRGIDQLKHSYYGLITIPGYMVDLRTSSDSELQLLQLRAQAGLTSAGTLADRLEEWGRFADAAKARDALVDFQEGASPEVLASNWIAKAAIAHALAGDRAGGAKLAAAARANFNKRIADGDPEKGASEIVELLDLYGIIESADAGDLKTARRLFAARSQWVAASFGSVVEMTRRLRQGAAPDELIGGLAKSPDQLWTERADARRAETIAKDSDNKTLFWLLPGATFRSGYEALSGQVWRADKSRMLLKLKDADKLKLKMERLFLYGSGIEASLDAYALHAALLAKSRGQQGFVILPISSGAYMTAAIRTGNRGDAGFPDAMFNDAEETIASLSPLIPDPVELKQRRAKAKAK